MPERTYRAQGVELKVVTSDAGAIERLALCLESPGNIVTVSYVTGSGVHAFVDGRLRDEDIGGSHPLARVAEMRPVTVPARIVRAAIASLGLDAALEAQVSAALVS